MKSQKNSIKQFELSPNSRAGMLIVNMENREDDDHDVSKPHRDNHCQFMFAVEGDFKLNIDFENIKFTGPAMLFVFPDQVHHVIEVH